MNNQDKLNYIAGAQFKADLFTGAAPEEKTARARFFNELLDHAVQQGDTDRVTSLRLFLQWYAAGLQNVYAAQVETRETVKALASEFTRAIVSVSGGAPFDQEAFLEQVESRVASGVQKGMEGSSIELTFTPKQEG